MAKFDFRKLLDRIKLTNGTGTVQPKDWDKGIGACIMQVVNLNYALDNDEFDPVRYIQTGQSYHPSDNPNIVDSNIRPMFIAMNDTLGEGHRDFLLRFITSLSRSKGSTELSKRRLQKIREYGRETFGGNTSEPSSVGAAIATDIKAGKDPEGHEQFLWEVLNLQDNPLQTAALA